MPIVILLSPIVSRVTSLCSMIEHKGIRRFDGEIANVTKHAITKRKNIISFATNVPGDAENVGDWRCKRCSSDKFVVRKESRVCLFCGESCYYEPRGAISAAMSSHRKYNANSSKRLAHFKNWIARIQGKERCSISTENIEKVRQIVKDFPSSYSEHDSIKLALRQLKLSQYYNHIYYIMRHVYGYALVDFRKINEARLVAMFMRIQEPFSKAQNSRTNMISYLFLIRKFCELLGYSVAKYIPLLKSRPNLQRQDYIWKTVCDELGLPFYPST